MKIITISDTHGCHRELNLPKGDMLLHAGDICNMGNKDDVNDFIEWFSELNFKYKIFIRGNHDWDLINNKSLVPEKLPDNIIYLNHSGCDINGIKIYGVPYLEEYPDSTWDDIPNDTNIVITHNPPYGIHDKAPNGRLRGSENLRNKILEINPILHLFGHIHVSYGQSKIGKTAYINPSNYQALLDKIGRKPIIFNYPK